MSFSVNQGHEISFPVSTDLNCETKFPWALLPQALCQVHYDALSSYFEHETKFFA